MDRFVVKTPRYSDVAKKKRKKHKLKQTRIENSLTTSPRVSDVKCAVASHSRDSGGGQTRKKQEKIANLVSVVSLTMIAEAKQTLKSTESANNVKLDVLQRLSKKLPSIEVLQSTSIGKVVKQLTKHEDTEISAMAAIVINAWETHIRKRKSLSLLDVKCDAAGESIRNKAKEMMRECFSEMSCSSETNEDLPATDEFERAVFFYCDRRTTQLYRSIIRKIVAKLRNCPELRVRISTNPDAFSQLLDEIGSVEKRRTLRIG